MRTNVRIVIIIALQSANDKIFWMEILVINMKQVTITDEKDLKL